MRRLSVTAALAACLFATLFANCARAEYPDRPIHLIVPQAAGSATDTLARIFAASFGDVLGQQIVVDDRPGGALTVGMDLTAKAAPDGYTLCMSPIGALALTSNMVEHLPYDVTRDFTPIGLVTRGHLLMAVSPNSQFHSVKEVIDYAKANPGKLSNASSSNGSPGHVDAELFKYMTGTDIVHVPYKGGAPAINDLIAGRVEIMFESLNSIAPFARSGQVRGLAVTGERRSPAFPDLPTIAEAGVPGYAAPSWTGVVGPAGLPQPIVDRLNTALNKAVRSDAFKARIAEIGDEIPGGTPQDFAALIASEYKKWGVVIKRAGIKIE
ncbi:MAG TPA: tripartite tricarboxylate transporter substrate binding protein [Xanthobacteraceae bacterium]|jgi:tripartite-type tricarboxylate transporter receptor subunit TctC|nr:tripartite tricarboxylate transporter substrate binding protein [Xanthobacteraceae bacterium]